jgi:hypothetical protein
VTLWGAVSVFDRCVFGLRGEGGTQDNIGGLQLLPKKTSHRCSTLSWLSLYFVRKSN